MKFYTLKFTVTLVLMAFIASCVSIDISKNNVKKAQGVNFRPPDLPFKKIESDDIDVGWRNDKNGNTITVLSDCENPYDPSLANIEEGVVSGLQELKKINSKESMYNGRASRQSVFTGTVDGIPTKINLMIFKKNNCIYVLSFLALIQHYNHDEAKFQTFLQRFEAP